MTPIESFPPQRDSSIDRVVALVAELREAWSQYRVLLHQLRPDGPGGPGMQAAAPRLSRLSKEADRQRPYLLDAEQRWEDYSSADQHASTLLGQYDRTLARMQQAHREGREAFADALERSLQGFRAEITEAAGQRAESVVTAFEAAAQVYRQAGSDGVVTRGQVDASALEALDADQLARRKTLTEFQSAEQALFRAGWTVEGRRASDGVLWLRPCHGDGTDVRFVAVEAALGASVQLADEQPTPGVLRLRCVSPPDRHLNAVVRQDHEWELDR
ncbi:hypothetical protein [Nocardia brasiliensis]|uniref:hypothetical protein n=1 Tax=Nocardia brasiliensis TaxID=37326 RepID=UPI0024582B6C|nr:hypothetical protein [Nocardia brasiliensis]